MSEAADGLSARTLHWLAQVLGRDPQVVRASPLVGGITSCMWLVEVPGERYVLRQMTLQPWAAQAEALLGREASSQRLLAGSSVPVPTHVAADPSGTLTGAPCLLMSWLPGVVMLGRGDDAVLIEMARVLVTIHRTVAQVRPRTYQSWAGAGPWPVPEWSDAPSLWERANSVGRAPPPTFQGVFLHRDYNPGNLLWLDSATTAPAVSGVVDWVETSWGPADLDVAHCAKYLAMLHGTEAAARFVELYGECGGRVSPDPSARRYWLVLCALAMWGPERGMDLWRAQGRTLVSLEDQRRRIEQFLSWALEDSGAAPI